MSVRIDVLRQQEPDIVAMPVGRRNGVPRTVQVQTAEIIGHAVLQIVLQWNQKVLRYPIFLRVQGATQDHVSKVV